MRAAIVCVLLEGIAHAGGALVADDGSAGLARAGAFAAKADDPTALWYDPAGFARCAPSVFVGANAIAYDLRFARADAPVAGAPFASVHDRSAPVIVPMIAAALRRGRWGVGFGVMAPQGDGDRDLPTATGGAPAPQRYDVVRQRAWIVLPSLAAAVALTPRVRIGARASVGYASVSSTKVVQGLANAGEDPDTDSWVTLSATDARIVTGALGVQIAASDAVELAVVATAPIHVHAVGTSDTALGVGLATIAGTPNYIQPVPDAQAACAPGGARGAIATCVDLAIPATATAAARYVVRDADRREVGDLELDLRWEDWSAASDTVVRVDGVNHALAVPIAPTVVRHGFRDVWSARLGGSVARGRVTLRGGLAYDSAAAPVSWTRLDLDGDPRLLVAAGVGVAIGRWRVDVGGGVILEPRRVVADVAIDPGAPRVQPDVPVPLLRVDQQPYHPFNAGTYEGRYTILSLGVVRAW